MKKIVCIFLLLTSSIFAFTQNYEIKNVKIDYNGTCAAFVTFDIYWYSKYQRKADICVNKTSDYYTMYWEFGNGVYQPKFNSLSISNRNLSFNNIYSIDKAVECYLNAWLKNANASSSNNNSNNSNNNQTVTEDKSYLNFTPGSQYNSSLTYGRFSDTRDGKTYKTIKIGTQTWFAENLAYKTSSGSWAYDNDESNVARYGRLYDWETSKSVCPTGWHLPSEAEWNTLINYLGGEKYAGCKLQATIGWKADKDYAVTNESGFSALPAGDRYSSSEYSSSGACFWSNTVYCETDSKWGKCVHMYYIHNEIYHWYYGRVAQVVYGYSVRCIKNK